MFGLFAAKLRQTCPLPRRILDETRDCRLLDPACALTPEIYFATPTVKALLQAAVVEASAFQSNARGVFPVEIQLADGKKTADAGPLIV